MSESLPNLHVTLRDGPRFFVEVDIHSVLYGYGRRSGRALRRELHLIPGEHTHGLGFAAIGIQSAVEAGQSCNTAGWIDEPRSCNVHSFYLHVR